MHEYNIILGTVLTTSYFHDYKLLQISLTWNGELLENFTMT